MTKKIMIVDDDPAITKYLDTLLSYTGGFAKQSTKAGCQERGVKVKSGNGLLVVML